MQIPKAIFLNILLLAACDTNGQQIEEDSLITIVCTFPEYIEAGYPGGISIWQKHVLQFVNPARAKRKGAPAGFYQVEVAFLIKKDGSIDSVKALSNNGFGMERKVIKDIRKTSR